MKRASRRISPAAVTAIILAVAVVIIAAFTFRHYTQDSYLTLKGDENVSIGLYGVYTDPGVNAVKDDRDVSSDVKVSGEIDPGTPGNYTLTYTSGNFTVSRTVTVENEMNPAIKLKGDNEITVKLGETVDEPGYTATASDGTDLTDQVEVSDVDFTKAGTNNIKYTVSDSDGNTTQITRNVTVEPNTDYDTPGLAICMFHYVYDEDDPPDDLEDRYGNYIGAKALTEELNWLNDEGYYYPTWQEVRDYVDGKLILPDKSVVLTFDDGAKSFLKYGIPVLEACKTPATSFVITSVDGKKKVKKYQSEYVDYESHSHNMHRGGGSIGHGGIFTAISYEEGMADLKKSIEIVGNHNAFAYPFGDYNDSSKQMVEDAGFLCAVTTYPGKVYPGDDPYLLNRQRMSLRQSLSSFQGKVRP